MLIAIITYAKGEEGAVYNAHKVLERLCGSDEFDNYIFETYEMYDKSSPKEELRPQKYCNKLGSSACETCKDKFICWTNKKKYTA